MFNTYGISPYLALLQRRQPEPEPPEDRYGFFMPRSWGGEDVSPETSRLARGRSLLAFGAPLLAAGGTGDFGGALAQAATGFSDAMTGTLEEQRQIARHQRQDELEREVAERQAEESGVRIEGARQDIAFKTEQQGREEAERQAKAERVRSIAAQIAQLSPGSPEAEKAEAYSRGDRPDLFEDEVGQLHEAALSRSRRDEDLEWQIKAGIRKTQEEVEAGVTEDPLAAGRRAERGLALEAERNAIYRQENSVAEGGSSDDAERAALAFEDDVRQEANQLFDAWERQRMQGVGKPSTWFLEASPKEQDDWRRKHPGVILPNKTPPTPDEIDAARREAERRAIESIRRRRQASGVSAAPAGGTYVYDRSGTLVRQP